MITGPKFLSDITVTRLLLGGSACVLVVTLGSQLKLLKDGHV